ncbi:MAG: hypothetical protein A2857_01480 [Candidatus Levybacteria bacterium RIFCSPHIGHO2_01_FULL_36_15]|nr:MAG: hypothetical protein A2857_01480 [Candidatus Levybacteria bacterium RIFCSPHIGHO2_01_FULL_36_15]OGH39280.1 MAG: hypothetical protein A2905_00250 [Candidatus Levybacteria bacterium RIFCSPLOWO2_01_FULL_36_10]
MADLTQAEQQEAVVRAVVERPPVGPQVPGSVQERAAKIRLELAAQGPKSALEAMRQAKESKEISDEKVKRVVDENIGWKRNAAGARERDKEETARFNTANKNKDRIAVYLKEGYDKLNPAQKTDVLNAVERALRISPQADQLLFAMSDDVKKATIEAKLKDPEFAAKVKEVFEGVINADTLNSEIVAAANLEFQKAKDAEEKKQEEINTNKGQTDSVDKQLEDFDIGKPKGDQIARHQANVSIYEDTIEIFNTQIADFGQTLQQLNKNLSNAISDNVKPEIDRLRAEIAAKTDERNALIIRKNEGQTQLNELKNLILTREDLNRKRIKFGEDRINLDKDMDRLRDERARTEGALEKAKHDKEIQEWEFIDKLGSTFSSATVEYVEGKLAAAEAKQAEIIKQEIAVTTDPVEKKMLEDLQERYKKTRKVGLVGRRATVEQDKAKAKEDYSTMLEKGPKDIMKSILVAQGMSPTDADTKLKDDAFVAKMQPKLVEKILTARLKTAQITESEAEYILGTDWGKEAIQHAINTNKESQAAIEALRSQNVLKPEQTLMDKYKEIAASHSKNKKGALAIMLALLFGTAFFGAVPVSMAIKESLTER